MESIVENSKTVLANVEPQETIEVKVALTKAGIKYEVVSNNLQNVIDEERANITVRSQKRTVGFDLRNYHSYFEIVQFLKQQSTQRNNVKYFSIGRTAENREIPGVILTKGDRQTREVFLIECGIHAREWVSPAACLWIINNLLEKKQSLLNYYDFHFIVVLNPDGYEYTRYSRLWRKNRSVSNSRGCRGTDINRNFDSAFCSVGASRDPCQETYCGTEAFSELESLAIKNYVLSLGQKLKIYISIHSFSQTWMSPYGYTYDSPANNVQLQCLADYAVNAVKSIYGMTYTTGNIGQALNYLAAGGSIDWIYDSTSCKVVFALELRDTGRYGFMLPPNQIEPTSIEVMAGIESLVTNFNNC